MKKLLFVLTICLGASLALQSQNPTNTTNTNTQTTPTQQDYERMLQGEHQMAFREQVITSLGLTKDQISAFDPIYREYMQAKNALVQEKVKLLEKYAKEIPEEETAKKQDEEVGDFIEDYWEAEIKEMELKKDYFDKLEDKITADRAFAFFMMEDFAQGNIERRFIERRYVPIFIEVEKNDASTGNMNPAPKGNTDMNKPTAPRYKTDVDAFNTWMQSRTGKEGLDHQYTRDGLKSLVTAVESLSMSCGAGGTTNLNDKKNRVLQISDELTKEPHSNKHADLAREAFILSADMMKAVQQKCNMSSSQQAIVQMDEAARKMDINKGLLKQTDGVAAFFKKAQTALNSMASTAPGASKN